MVDEKKGPCGCQIGKAIRTPESYPAEQKTTDQKECSCQNGTAGMTRMSPLEASHVAGVGEEHVRRALRLGRLRGQKIGRRWVVDARDLDEWTHVDERRRRAMRFLAMVHNPRELENELHTILTRVWRLTPAMARRAYEQCL